MKTKNIALNLLVSHPQRLQRAAEKVLYKLKRQIEASGCYEPIVVRPHPSQTGKFEIINGHSRVMVLKALGRRSALCVIWDLEDMSAELALATVNSLAGAEIPERRAALLAGLLSRFSESELEDLLPENKKKLAVYARLAKLSQEPPQPKNPVRQPIPYVIAAFKLKKEASRQLTLALELLGKAKGISHSEAIAELAGFYLDRCIPKKKHAVLRRQTHVHAAS